MKAGDETYLQGADSGVAARQRDLVCDAYDKTLRATAAAQVFCHTLLAVGYEKRWCTGW